MKRVLIITYYWPPSGGAGVQRWLKFSKYLPKFGWQPVVFTPENVEAPVIDHSLLQDFPPEVEVVKNRIWEPYDLYKFFLGKKKEDKMQTGFISEGKQKPKIQENISIWIRGNFFIPDARKFWIKPSIKHLSKYLNENPVDAIVSTGPPHSTHLIALALKKQFNLPWIADFRDPWTNIDFYKDLKLSKWADKKHRSLEKKVLNTADQIICVSNTMKQEFQEIASDAKIQVITNGYDESDYAKTTIKKQDKITFAHIGSISPNRNPLLFWEAMSLLVKKIGIETLQQKVTIQLIGNVDYSVKQTIINKGLETLVEYVNHVPHNEVTVFQQKAHYLILAINNSPNAKGVLTGKLFEYLASGTPIIGVGPLDGDAAEILNKTGCGKMHDDVNELLIFLLDSVNNKSTEWHRNSEIVKTYSREFLTKKLTQLLNNI
jgi:glycosyltransferase involved in cell wall biosynthesis